MAEIPAAVEAELARLRAENTRLLKLLSLTPQQAAPPRPSQAAYFEAPPGVVHHMSPQDAKVAFFGALFAARTDVYAIRFDNQRTGSPGGSRQYAVAGRRESVTRTGAICRSRRRSWRRT